MSDVLVLYQISNEFGTPRNTTPNISSGNSSSSSYNAFSIPRKNNGVTLASIKSHIITYGILPGNGYHWRVRIDDRQNSSDHSGGGGGGSGDNSGGKAKYSWWDIQDENARLPIKEATTKELKKMFGPPKVETSGDVTQEVTKAAKGAMKFMGKLAGGSTSTSHHQSGSGGHHGGYEYDDDGMDDDYGQQQQQQRTAVICFKVLDLNQVRRDCGGSVGGGGGGVRRAIPSRRTAPPRNNQTAAPSSAGAPRVPNNQRTATAPRTSAPTGNLMDFGSSSTGSSTHQQQQQQRNIHHANSMPASTSTATGKAHPNETRAEKLKREYAKKQAQSNRVWDDVDQRWVEGPVKNGEVKATTTSTSVRSTTTTTASASVATVTKSVKGISLSTTNAVGKSATVQAAVHARVTEMETNKQKAIAELRNREAAKANADAEEDLVRQRLDPKLKAWSEEHGKKKQLRALLANLHTILWEGSGWKQVSLADVLDDSKVKRVYHKASRVVHPDKTGHLDAEKRFVAKRVFDALTQAKVEFDEGKR